MGPDSPTSKVTGYGLDDWGSYPSKIIFLLAIMNTPAPTQAEKGPFPIWQFISISAEIKNTWRFTSMSYALTQVQPCLWTYLEAGFL